jgi:hypothetical protein
MPRLSCWFIRVALFHLTLGFTFGGLLLFHKGVSLHPFMWRLLPAHIEFLLLGWTVQLAMGVMFWMLPRFGGGASRGNETAAWWAFGLLNLGVWMVAFGTILGTTPLLPFLGRVIEVGAAVAFALHAWPRIKPLSV